MLSEMLGIHDEGSGGGLSKALCDLLLNNLSAIK